METIDIQSEMMKEYVRRYYTNVEDDMLNFCEPYQGLEKINGTEFKLHIVNSDYILPFGAIIAARAYDKNIEIIHSELHSTCNNSKLFITRTISDAYVNLRLLKLKRNDYILIKTSEDMGSEPRFIIANILKVGNPVNRQPNTTWMTRSTTANSSGTITTSLDMFNYSNKI